MSAQHIDLWDWDEDAEELNHHDTAEDAAEAFVEAHEADWEEDGVPPESVTVYGFVRMVPKDPGFSPLERLLEDWDEDYGSPDESTAPTARMLEAEAEFLRVVRAEYKSWQCEQVAQRTFSIAEVLAWREQRATAEGGEESDGG